jgi:hypothetical protein
VDDDDDDDLWWGDTDTEDTTCSMFRSTNYNYFCWFPFSLNVLGDE